MNRSDESTPITPIVAESAPRLRLVTQEGAEDGATLKCRRVVTLLGSRPGCKVVLRHRHVSPVHMVIVNNGFDILAVDLVTRNGTLLNDLKMEHETLSEGDRLTIDPWSFRVEIELPEQHGREEVNPFGLDPTPHLVALEHLSTGRILQPNRDVCVLGRRAGCDVIIPDAEVSRAHCILFNYFGHPAIFDLLSRNQTLVNGQPITYHLLQDNDILTLGDTQFRVRLVGSSVGNGSKQEAQSAAASQPFAPVDLDPDEVDIESMESAKSWKIADRVEEISRDSSD